MIKCEFQAMSTVFPRRCAKRERELVYSLFGTGAKRIIQTTPKGTQVLRYSPARLARTEYTGPLRANDALQC